jgi:hypothetical protein
MSADYYRRGRAAFEIGIEAGQTEAAVWLRQHFDIETWNEVFGGASKRTQTAA